LAMHERPMGAGKRGRSPGRVNDEPRLQYVSLIATVDLDNPTTPLRIGTDQARRRKNRRSVLTTFLGERGIEQGAREIETAPGGVKDVVHVAGGRTAPPGIDPGATLVRVLALGRGKAHRTQIVKRRRGNVLPDANVAVVAALHHRDTTTHSCQGARRGKSRRSPSDNKHRRLGLR